jgi:hypothetical protein
VLAVILVRKWAAAGSNAEDTVEPTVVLSDENERWIREALRNG